MNKAPLSVAVVANWGVGREMLAALLSDNRLQLTQVLTQYESNSSDAWHNIVYDFAVQQGMQVHVLEADSIRHIDQILSNSPVDLLFVHAYSRRLPMSLLSKPRVASVNLHPSLLPSFRGRHPVREMLSQGANVAGLTFHLMDEDFDTGNIIVQRAVEIAKDDNEDTLIERMKLITQQLTTECVTRILNKMPTQAQIL